MCMCGTREGLIALVSSDMKGKYSIIRTVRAAKNHLNLVNEGVKLLPHPATIPGPQVTMIVEAAWVGRKERTYDKQRQNRVPGSASKTLHMFSTGEIDWRGAS